MLAFLAPYMVVVSCLSTAAVCERVGTPDLGRNSYATRTECDRALLAIAKAWNPGNAAYAFNCRGWPW